MRDWEDVSIVAFVSVGVYANGETCGETDYGWRCLVVCDIDGLCDTLSQGYTGMESRLHGNGGKK